MFPAIVFIVISVLATAFSNVGAVKDFCVANLNSPMTPAGYPCKDPGDVTADDFVFKGLGVAGNTTGPIKASFAPAFVGQLPAVNGLGISGGRADLAPGGFFPMHSHPTATEFIVVLEGKVTAGFIASNNTPYLKSLKKGDSMVLPQGLLHFVLNDGSNNAVVLAFFSGSNPVPQVTSLSFFGNNLPTDLVAKTTFLDPNTVKKLKAVLGGSG